MTALDYARTVTAEDSVIAQGAVVALATAEGYRVRTVKAVRLADGTDWPPRYTVTLAVEERAMVPAADCE